MERYRQLAHVAIRCNDFKKMYAFYVDALGGRELFHLNRNRLPGGEGNFEHWLTYIVFGKNSYIELFSDPYCGENRCYQHSFVSFCLETGNMELTLMGLEKEGVAVYDSLNGTPLSIPHAQYREDECGTCSVFIKDPEGNWIEIQQYTAHSYQILCGAR